MFKRYTQVLDGLGDGDFEEEHAGTEKRRKTGQSQDVVDINKRRSKRRWAGGLAMRKTRSTNEFSQNITN